MLRSFTRRVVLPLKPNYSVRVMSSESVLSFKNVTFEYLHDKPIIKNANFSIQKGSKVTIMGQNGSGKSTIIKMINGSLKNFDGTINMNQKAAVATAMQVMPREYRELTVLEFFIKQLHGVESGISSTIAKSLQAVKLDAPHDRKIKSFSGGQQARLLLASALALNADILLLDEPTNNLDVAGVDMLKSFIQNTDLTCVVISHDETFLNSFTDSVLYLDAHSKNVEQYNGNYNTVKSDIAARIRKENSDNARLMKEAQAKKDQANVFANKGGGMRKVAKKMREVAQEKEGAIVEVRKEDYTLKPFEFPFAQDNSAGSGSTLMTIKEVVLPGEVETPLKLLSPVVLDRGMHVRILGPNGIGKTTLLEAIANRRLKGVTINPKVEIGYYRQDFHNLDFDSTVIATLQKAANGKSNEQEIRSTGAYFFLSKDVVKQKVVTLSEGQKGLLSLACLVLQKPGILIMDEPTNHINFRHLPALAKALSTYQGALLFVSHDHGFAKKVRIDAEIDLQYELNRKVY